MNKIFFIADLHLGHANIIKYCDRPFHSVREMNETLIQNWNQTVGKSDMVFFLGDFGFGSADQIVEWGQQLNGNKILILGNHDKKSIEVYYDTGFSFISKYPILWNGYFLSHEPINTSYFNIHWHIHIHIHNHLPYEYDFYNKYNLCVSADMINYKPVIFEEITKRRNRLINDN